MSTTGPGPARGDQGGSAGPEELAARRQDADVAAAGIESNFLTFRMLPQMVLPIGGIPLFVFFIIGSDDPAVTIRCLAGIALMAASVWLHFTSFRERQRAAHAALRGETYDRSGFYRPYLAWFLGLLGFAGPWYFN
ncbi:hypothetical protein G7072_12280 [Nocardioides sp. HDW12B]|uniref:hypothetical protein n=1 Tax=Nocardioides sp. HDW12B TaxID=2714939 RepID=UPI00140CB753|nr:hypothetical protein [Nocardioides sp. HDW12B]QIK67016.1 hypothetical protein G7072_12280 [Nocardioides sp. HDW12B]